MNVIIAGGTGFIGTALTSELLAEGHEVVILTRNPRSDDPLPGGVKFLEWDGENFSDWVKAVEHSDAIVNLVGENLAGGRWTESRKSQIISSRVNAGRVLTNAILQASHKPKVLIQASGAGAYGISKQTIFNENGDFGTDFLASVCKEWESSTKEVESVGVRRVIIRSGVVLDAVQGALPKMLLPFKFFVGGPLGSGDQWLPWVHIKDEVRAIKFLLENPNTKGIINISASPVTNKEFARAVGQSMQRPALIRLPGFVLKLLFGEMSTVLLDGQNISSEKIQNLGFTFQYLDIHSALSDLLMNKQI